MCVCGGGRGGGEEGDFFFFSFFLFIPLGVNVLLRFLCMWLFSHYIGSLITTFCNGTAWTEFQAGEGARKVDRQRNKA